MNFDKPTLNDNLIILTGLRSSGKSLISPFLINCNVVSGLLKDPTASAISDMYRNRSISLESASFLFKLSLDNARYCNRIGRNLNSRLEDETSIWNSYDVTAEIKKLVSPRGETVTNHMQSDNKFHIFDTHNGIPALSMFAKCYANLVLINVVRSPISVIFSWCRDGLFTSERLNSALSQQVCVINNNEYVPIIFHQKLVEFSQLTHLQRCLQAYSYLENEEQNYRKKNLKYEKLIFDISYEKFLQFPEESVRNVLSLIGASIEPNRLISLFERENVPREISLKQIDEKYLALKDLANPSDINTLDKLYNTSIECF